MKRWIPLLLVVALVGCAQKDSSTQTSTTEGTTESPGTTTPAGEAPSATNPTGTTSGTGEPGTAPEHGDAEAVTVGDHGTTVKLLVTEAGFVPPHVHVPAGKPVTLQITRQTDKTCATELVMKEHNLNVKLPLNQTVEATFTPKQAGELTYACGMDMIKGVVHVQ